MRRVAPIHGRNIKTRYWPLNPKFRAVSSSTLLRNLGLIILILPAKHKELRKIKIKE
jgi:hypothetical protein